MDLPTDIWARIWGHLDDIDELGAQGTRGVILTAATAGDVPVLDFIRRTLPNFMDYDELIMEKAAERGLRNVLRWMLPFGPRETVAQMIVAARHGQLGVLRYFHERGYFMHEDVIDSACRGGHWRCVLWALEHGYPISDEVRWTGQFRHVPWAVPWGVTRALNRRLFRDAALARIREGQQD